MDVDDDRALARELRRGHVEKAGYALSIEALPAHRLRLGEGIRIQPAGFAGGPAVELPAGHVDRIGVRRGSCRGNGEAKVGAVLVPLQPGDQPGRQVRQRLLLASRRLQQMQPPKAVLVADKGDPLAVSRHGETLNVPGYLRRQALQLATGRIQLPQTHKLRPAIGRGVDALAIRSEDHARPCHLLASLGCDQGAFARFDLDEPEVAFIDGDALLDHERAPIGRPVPHAPSAAGKFDHKAVGLRVHWIHHVDVRIFPVSPGGGIGDALAVGGPDGR